MSSSQLRVSEWLKVEGDGHPCDDLNSATLNIFLSQMFPVLNINLVLSWPTLTDLDEGCMQDHDCQGLPYQWITSHMSVLNNVFKTPNSIVASLRLGVWSLFQFTASPVPLHVGRGGGFIFFKSCY